MEILIFNASGTECYRDFLDDCIKLTVVLTVSNQPFDSPFVAVGLSKSSNTIPTTISINYPFFTYSINCKWWTIYCDVTHTVGPWTTVLNRYQKSFIPSGDINIVTTEGTLQIKG